MNEVWRTVIRSSIVTISCGLLLSPTRTTIPFAISRRALRNATSILHFGIHNGWFTCSPPQNGYQKTASFETVQLSNLPALFVGLSCFVERHSVCTSGVVWSLILNGVVAPIEHISDVHIIPRFKFILPAYWAFNFFLHVRHPLTLSFLL